MNWLSLIKQDHKGIEQAFNKCLKCTDFGELGPLLKELSVLLARHSKAEEASVYTSLAQYGFKEGANELWEEQDHAGQVDSEIMRMYKDKDSLRSIHRTIQTLKNEVLVHAISHEEKDYFPKLMEKLSPMENEELLKLYKENYYAT